jgi:hypothetical protein
MLSARQLFPGAIIAKLVARRSNCQRNTTGLLLIMSGHAGRRYSVPSQIWHSISATKAAKLRVLTCNDMLMFGTCMQIRSTFIKTFLLSPPKFLNSNALVDKIVAGLKYCKFGPFLWKHFFVLLLMYQLSRGDFLN